MAIGDPIEAAREQRGPGSQTVQVASCKGNWVQINDDARTTQDTLDLGGITSSTFHWRKVPDGVTRIHVAGRTPAATTTITTSPIIRIVGVWGELSDGAVPDGVRVDRIDNTDHNATGITVPLQLGTAVFNDATWDYSERVATGPYDLNGATYYGYQVITAAAIDPDAAVPLDALELN